MTIEKGDDVFIFYEEDFITCPDCSARCDHPDAKAGVAECLGCGISFNYEIEEDEDDES